MLIAILVLLGIFCACVFTRQNTCQVRAWSNAVGQAFLAPYGLDDPGGVVLQTAFAFAAPSTEDARAVRL
jgi:hypothetical protein